MILSRFKGFEKPKFGLEQYQTEPEIAAEIAWNMFYRREIEGKVIADLGCGTGILGFSTVLLGAKKVYFVDIDEKALQIAKENMKMLKKEAAKGGESMVENLDEKCVFLEKNVSDFDEKVDIVLQNPPFGIQTKTHTDRVFLEHAFKIADIIYSFHKAKSKQFIDAVSADNGFKVGGYWEFDFPLKMTMKFHKKRIQRIKVGCWRLEKL